MYESNTTLITQILKGKLNTDRVTVQTYVRSTATTVSPKYNSLSVVQHTPFQSIDENSNRIAAVRKWVELDVAPVGYRFKRLHLPNRFDLILRPNSARTPIIEAFLQCRNMPQ
jgi:hypothetical protein